MDEHQRRQISVEECGEICDRLLADMSGVTDTAFLWEQLWLRLCDELGEDPDLPLDNSAVLPSETERIQNEMLVMLKGHSPDSDECLRVFMKRIGAHTAL